MQSLPTRNTQKNRSKGQSYHNAVLTVEETLSIQTLCDGPRPFSFVITETQAPILLNSSSSATHTFTHCTILSILILPPLETRSGLLPLVLLFGP